jgi:tetratricopeptide (TPR) repeat protein
MLSILAQYYKAIDIKAFGPDHNNVVAIYRNNLGLARKSKGKYNKAIKYHKLALKSLEKTNLPHKAKTVQKIISSLKNQR